jgi:hypothetical protein
MTSESNRLPLEGRLRDDTPRAGRGSVFRFSGVAAVAQIGLCLSALTFPIYVALALIPAAPQLGWYEKPTAAFGACAMVTLGVLCVALLKRVTWSRRAMLAFSMVLLAWESIKLPLALFVYAPGRKLAMTRALTDQMAAATQPTSRPSQFDSFMNAGIYVMPIITFLALGGFAWWSIRVMRGPAAKAIIGR